MRHQHLGGAIVLFVVTALSCSIPGTSDSSGPRAASTAQPPPDEGYFRTLAEGAWRQLPSDTTCDGLIHRSSWEPRPLNAEANDRVPDPVAVREAFTARPRSDTGGFAPRWDSWLLRRVDGGFTGTTDEIFQWAACKWGLADNLLRAIAVRESTWYQDATSTSGACVPNWGCGDLVAESTRATRRYCRGLTAIGGYDYEADHAPGICPKTFSIMGVMSWQDPRWGRFPGNQNGTFPFNRDDTAFAVDYLAATLRGCLEGWEPWLANTGRHPYRRGDVWGCVGSWFAGAWRTPAAMGYIARVQRALDRRTWLNLSFAETMPPCDPACAV